MMASKKKFEIVFLVGLVLFCITIPFSTRINNFSYVPLLIGWLGESTWSEKISNLKRRRFILLLVLYYLFSLLTLFYSDNVGFGLKVLETQIKMVVFPILMSSAASLTAKRIDQIKKTWTFSIVLLTIGLLVYAFLQYLETGSTHYFFYHDLTDPLFNLNAIYLANFLALAGLFVVYSDWSKNATAVVIFKTGIILFTIVMIFMLSALSVIIFVFALTFLLSIQWLSARLGAWKAAMTGFVMIGFLGLLILTIPYTQSKISKLSDLSYKMDYPDSLWNSATIRLAIGKCGLDVAKENFLMGTGVGDEMDKLFESYRKNSFNEGIRCEYNLHNQYLSSFVIGGVILFAMLVVMMGYPLMEAVRKKNYLMMSFLILILLTFLTENFLRLHKGVSFFSFFYSLLLIRNDSKN
jgi:O-Antigen ligase.